MLSAAERTGADEFSTRPEDQRRAALRARVMGVVGRVSSPAFALLGIRPEAVPLSTSWIPRARSEVRKRVRTQRPDIILATGPPMAALIAAALATRPGSPPLVVELRDLWAGNPAFDRRGGLLGRLERWVFDRAAAVIATTPEAVADLRARHPQACRVDPRDPERVRAVPSRAPRAARAQDRRSSFCTQGRSRPTGRCDRC